jgi:hypothetical protein
MSGSATCVLGLKSNGANAIHLKKNARLTASGCAVYANSANAQGLRVDDMATISAEAICVAGGFKVNSGSSTTPSPTTDCPPYRDPLEHRTPPPVGSCTHDDLVINNQTTTLEPGTYCGGLRIDGSSNVTFEPGIYVIRDGSFTVSGTATVTGEYAGFYFTGNGARLNLDSKTTVDLTAPKDGPLAGILFFEDRDIPAPVMHKISSDNARRLLGTIYAPVSNLLVDSKAPVAGESAFTAIVANSVTLDNGPNLILHSDYDTTDVPLPEGLSGAHVVLSR